MLRYDKATIKQTNGVIDQKDLWNSIFLVGSEGVGRVLAIIVSVLVARRLGAEAFGDFSAAQSVALIFSVFVEVGLYTLVFREISVTPEQTNRYVVSALCIEIIATIVISGLLFGTVNFLGYSQQIIIATSFCWIWVLGIGYGRIVRVVLRANRLLLIDSIFNIFESTVRAILVIWIIWADPTPQNIAIMFALSSVITLICSIWFVYRRFISFRWEFDLAFLWKLLIRSLPFALTTMFTVSLYRLDTILLATMKDSYEVGIYNAAYRLNLNFFFIPTLICSALFPKLAMLSAAKDYGGLNHLIASLYRILTILVFPLLMILFLSSKFIIYSLYGTDYQDSTALLQILLWINLFTSWNYIATYTLNALGAERAVASALGIALLFNTVANIFFIPYFGYNASTLISLATEIISMLILHNELRKHTQFQQILKRIEPQKIGVVLGGSISVMILPLYMHFPLAYLILLFLICYGGLTMMTGLLQAEISLLAAPFKSRINQNVK